MNAKSANITVNGKRHTFLLPMTVAECIGKFGWQPSQVVVELNDRVVLRNDVVTIQLCENDKIEIVVPVAGG